MGKFPKLRWAKNWELQVGIDLKGVAKAHWSDRPRLNSSVTVVPSSSGTNNRHFRCEQGNSSYFIKLSDGWSPFDERAVLDMHEREELFSILAKALQLPVVDAWYIRADSLRLPPSVWSGNIIPDKASVSVWLKRDFECPACSRSSKSFTQKELLNLSDLFLYCLWIGDEDRKKSDVIWIGDRPHLFDQSLSGPTSKPNSSKTYCRGTHHQRFDLKLFSKEQVVKMSPSGYPSLLAHTVQDHSSELPISTLHQRIRDIEQRDIENVVNQLGMQNRIAEELCKRQESLKADYENWRQAVAEIFGPRFLA